MPEQAMTDEMYKEIKMDELRAQLANAEIHLRAALYVAEDLGPRLSLAGDSDDIARAARLDVLDMYHRCSRALESLTTGREKSAEVPS